MKLLTLLMGVSSLLRAQTVMAQSDPSSYLVTLYQLSYKPEKVAHKCFREGAALIRQHDYKDGIAFMQQALQHDSNYWLAANDLGFAYINLRDDVKAEQAFQRAIDIDPENAIGYANLGVAAAGLFDLKLAENCAHRALNLNPLLPQAKLLLSVIAICQGHWTPEVHKMLEEIESSTPLAAHILQGWPEHPTGSSPPEVLRSALQ